MRLIISDCARHYFSLSAKFFHFCILRFFSYSYLLTTVGMTCGLIALIVPTTRGTVRHWSVSSLSSRMDWTHIRPHWSAPLLVGIYRGQREREHHCLSCKINTSHARYVKESVVKSISKRNHHYPRSLTSIQVMLCISNS